jgi:hypothetical protein
MDINDSLAMIRPVKEAIEDELLQRPGVVGVDIGYKEVGGRRTDELAIRVLVEKKWDVPQEQRIPSMIQDIKTDVIQRGRITFLVDTTRYNPLVGGCSIGTCGGFGTGTLGALVRDRNTGQLMALSNWHVLVSGASGGVYNVAQPGPGDNGSCSGDIIGQVARSVINEYVDCAVVALNLGARNLQCSIQDIGFIGVSSVTSIGNRVKKRGRTSGLTWGDVDTIDLTFNVQIAGVTRTFKHQIGIWRASGVSEVFVRPGDSGSIVIDTIRGIVGLLFAGSGGNPFFPDGAYAYANPISAVLYALDIDICVPPKTKEKDKEKEKDELLREKIMKESDNELIREKIFTESQLLSLEAQTMQSIAESEARNAGPLEERLARLEAVVDELRHFIRQADRPNPGASSFQIGTPTSGQADDDSQSTIEPHES